MNGPVRPAAVAGQFYPGTAPALQDEIHGFLQSVQTDPVAGTVHALMAPHAGYMYSGQVAAYAYAVLEGRNYDAVAVISPSHRDYFKGVSVWEGSYRTPLGTTVAAPALAARMAGMDPLMKMSALGHGDEHALEVQIPFLQTVLPGVPVVPLVMGDQRPETCRTLGNVLANAAAGQSLLVVASSDLSHFHPYNEAVALDARVLQRVAAFDIDGLMDDLRTGTCEACGGGPVAAALVYARLQGGNAVRVLKYANSGDVTGDTAGVVGYASAAVFRQGQ